MANQSEFIEVSDNSVESQKGQDLPNFTLADADMTDIPDRSPSEVSQDGDLLIVASNDSIYPSTRQEQLQEFVDGFGRLGKMYHDSVGDSGRMGRFQERMGNVYQEDRQTFLDLAKVGDGLAQKPPLSPEQVGEDLAQAAISGIERQLQAGNGDLSSPEMQNIQGAVAGVMLAARSTFGQADMESKTRAMIDAIDRKFQEGGLPFLRGIIWGDTKEPGLAVVPEGTNIDRHNFLP